MDQSFETSVTWHESVRFLMLSVRYPCREWGILTRGQKRRKERNSLGFRLLPLCFPPSRSRTGVVDLKSDVVLAAEIRKPDKADPGTLADNVMEAQNNLNQARSQAEIEEVALDEGYHAAHTLELCEAVALRTDVPQPKRTHRALDGQAGGISTRRICRSTTP
jgi:hypothetical protein